MPEAFRLIDLPAWLLAFFALVLLIAGFVDGVVKFAENWPKFCAITRQVTAFLAYWCIASWWMPLSYAALRILVWLKIGAIIALPDPDGTDPAGAATRIRTSGAAAKRAPPLRVIQGGKSGTLDNILMPVFVLLGTIRGAVARLTYRGLVCLFGDGGAAGREDGVLNVAVGVKYRYFHIDTKRAAAIPAPAPAAKVVDSPTVFGVGIVPVDDTGIGYDIHLRRLRAIAMQIALTVRVKAEAIVRTVCAPIWCIGRVSLTRSLDVFGGTVANLSRAVEALLVDPGRLRCRPVA